MPASNRISTFLDCFYHSLGTFLGLVIALIALAISTDLGLRRFNIGSIGGVQEVVEYTLFACVFLGAPWVLRTGGHIRIEILAGILPLRARKKFARFLSGIGLTVTLALVYYGSRNLIDSYVLNSAQRQYFVIYEWSLLAIFVIGMTLCAFEFLRMLLTGQEHRPGPVNTPDQGMN
ncbi:TRAP transporter small permease [Ruegeria sp. EL01]|jgi:TRAP-type C4-dicarboxylate transport system permease small subunit|uniref:TRAP transporter small permease n=1 Tax=Ruegeria sp. EL01 TaxID=2107578 RepID=UPI0013C40F1D|nr:TRAP transporter small permease [Ruegeria sp. EL01]